MRRMAVTDNLRFVFAGGPGAGKTAVLDVLKARGFHCAPDNARAVIRARLDAGLPPRPAPRAFAEAVLDADIECYAAAAAGEVWFFERGVVDALGSLKGAAGIADAELERLLARYPYARVFLFPPWPEIYRTDDERDQTFTEAVRVFALTRAWYERCGYSTCEVPLLPVAERADFVEAEVRQLTGARP